MTYPTIEELELIKAQTQKTVQAGEIDEAISDLVLFVNAFQGVGTVFSCSGHTEAEQRREYDKACQSTRDQAGDELGEMQFRNFSVQPHQKTFIMLVADQDNFTSIAQNFNQWLMNISHNDWVKHRPTMSLTRLLKPFNMASFEHRTVLKFETKYIVGQFDRMDSIRLLEDFFKYYYSRTAFGQIEYSEELFEGTIKLKAENPANGQISVVRLINALSDDWAKNRTQYKMPSVLLMPEQVDGITLPMRSMPYIGDDSRSLAIYSLEDDTLAVSAVFDSSVKLVLNRLESTVSYSIKPTSAKAIKLLGILNLLK